MIVWQVFTLPNGAGIVAVPAMTEEGARGTLAKNAWNQKDPGWPLRDVVTSAVAPRLKEER